MRLADRLNETGVKLNINSDINKFPDVIGELPPGVRLSGTAGDAVDEYGDIAFFDEDAGRWFPVGPGPVDEVMHS